MAKMLTSVAMDYAIRPLTAADEPILWDMLYQALQTSEGPPPPDVVKRPEFARYVEGWGRPNDAGFVAHDKASAASRCEEKLERLPIRHAPIAKQIIEEPPVVCQGHTAQQRP